ncbi:hypothetical protein [Haliea sp.]
MSKLLTTLAAAIALAVALAHGEPSADPVDTQIQRDLHFHIAELADDAYEGREPGTPGEEKTIAWLQKHFAALGAEPGNRGSWVQEVPITAVTSAPSAVLAIRGPDFSADLAYGSEMMVATQQQVATTGIAESELVFVGYGINAPERDWNDYAGVDVTGKTVVILTNATDSVEHGKAWGDERLKDYTANHYHKPSDEYDADWDLSGAAQEVMLLLEMGRELAGNRDFPNWHEGVEFKRARDASLQQ